MIENKIDWNFLLTLKEFSIYLNNSELLVNSQLNKFIRVKLRPCIFKRLNINKLVKLLAKEIDVNSISEHKPELLDPKFSSIKNLVHTIEFNNMRNLFLAPIILNYFEFVSNFTFNGFIMPYNTISIILDSLKYLKTLKLNFCIILFHPNSKEAEVINLPKTLVSLDLANNLGLKTSYYNYIEKSLIIPTGWDSDISPVKLKFSCSLPNLKKLKFQKRSAEDATDYNLIIKNTDQLKIIDIYMDQLTLDTYIALASCKDLETIIINAPHRFRGVLQNESLPILNTVKNLNLRHILTYDFDNNLLYKITAPLINVTHLTISSVNLSYKQLYLITVILLKLEKLTIYCPNNNDTFEDFNLLSNSLKTLELIEFKNSIFNFNMLRLCDRINKVTIDTKNFAKTSISEYVEKLETHNNWRILKFKDSLNCYKLYY